MAVAMDKEFGLLRGLMSGGRDVSCQGLEFFEGKIGEKDVVLARSGLGKVCAAVGVLELIKNFAPDCVINTGVAGGIDVKTRVMDVVARVWFITTFGAASRICMDRCRGCRPVLPAAASFLTR